MFSFSLGETACVPLDSDANDEASIAELQTAGELTKSPGKWVARYRRRTGHIPMHRIKGEHGETLDWCR